ncbi:phage protein Gp36 family protein [Notoacmeibacter ruber]|uniref:DUF1320 domain-containing protein n=1 Tax=Notoacmeibacter ruber TaxID=2670375 RepID=A0A3L7JH09_9HYPH|nr:phage protein Gp36 family protein [Notoacmeibacter ruber]RLQ88911.1 DUF1320 domain-containing protein [Notoacmeibacter ruber]
MTALVTLADLEERHPAELLTLAADETTGFRDDDRIDAAIADATAQIRGMLKARYSVADLNRLDEESRSTLRIDAIDITLYRVALSFARSSERIEERYKAAIKRLEAIVTGKAALSFAGDDGETRDADASPADIRIDAPERRFTRRTMNGL